MPTARARDSQQTWVEHAMKVPVSLLKLSSAPQLVTLAGAPSWYVDDVALRGADATRRVNDDENDEIAQRTAFADCALLRLQRAAG